MNLTTLGSLEYVAINKSLGSLEYVAINKVNGDYQVCFVQGKPTISVKTCNTNSKWLYNTGTVVTVISEGLFKRFSP